MEPPTAQEEIKLENNYKINSDKQHLFNLTIQNLNSSIKIISSFEDNCITHNYEKQLLFDELKKNKLLGLCDSIDEIYDELIHNLNKNETKILEETNQIIINIPVDHLKIKEILFLVNEKKKNEKERIDELISVVSNLKNEIKDLKLNKNNEEIKHINEKINNLEKENIELKEKIQNLEKENFTLKEFVEKKINELDNTPNVFLPCYHEHILNLCLTNRSWGCDICKQHFNKSDKSYFCQTCDFDLCNNCFNKGKNENNSPLNMLELLLKNINKD